MHESSESVHVLHVDDEPGFADMVGAFLEREDDRFTVWTATTPTEGLDILATHEIDCVVSDYDLPDQNGVEFLQTIRSADSDLPFILYTGKGSEEVASDAISAGATDYLQKRPGTDQYELLATQIRNAVAQYRGERAQQRLVELAENTDRVLFSVSGDWSELLFVSSAYEDIWGRSSAALRDDPTDFLNAIHPDDRTQVREAMEAASNGDSMNIEYRLQSEDTHPRWLRTRAEPITDESGTIQHIAGFTADITETRRYRDRRERQRQTIVKLATDDAIVAGDFESALSRITETAADVLDVSRVNVWLADEATGVDILTCVDHYDKTTGEHTQGMELVVEDYPAYLEALETTQAIAADNAREDPRTAELLDYLDANNIGALLDGTLRSEGEVIGVICHEHVGDTRDWTEDEIDFASHIADIVHRAVRNRERKDREQELRRKERRYQAMFNDPNILVGLLDTDGTILDVNQTAVEYIDGTREEVTDSLFWETSWFSHSAALQQEVKQWVTEAASGEYVEFEADLQHPNGDPYTVEGVLRPVTDTDGTVTSILISDRDVTERKARERELELFRTLLDQSSDSVLVIEPETGQFLDVNETACRRRGYSREELLKLTVPELEPELPDITAWQSFVEDLKDKMEITYEATHQRKDGSTYPVEVNTTYLELDRDYVVAIARDITDRKQRETRLEETTSRLTALFENSPDLINVLTPDGVLVDMNRRFCEELGYDKDTVVGTPIWEIDQHVTESDVQALLSGFKLGERRKIEGRYERRDGSTFPVEVHLLRLDLEGENRFLAISRDITDRKRREQQLERQNERLDEFARMLSHDLRSPLSVAQGRLQLAAAECDSDHFEPIERAHSRMDTLIEEILTLAREGETVTDRELVDIASVANASWSNVRTAIASLIVDIDQTIEADKSRLKQLFENLFRNALDHGGPDVTVAVGALADRPGFYVSDDGPGIPEGDRDSVFEPGYTTREEGTGFGLAIVAEMVTAHGWTVQVTESETGGARFEFLGVESVA